jgi:hypothetical protein
MAAHIAEHVAMGYRRRVEVEAGITLPAPGQPVDPAVEGALSRLMAEAGDRVLQRNTAEAKAQANAQAAQDPMVILRQQELKIKEMEVQVKAMAAQSKAVSDAEKVKMTSEKERLEAQIALAELQLKGIELAIKAMQAQGSNELGERQANAQSALDALRMALETMNKAEDRGERRESAEKTARAKTRAKGESRRKPADKPKS